MFMIKAIVACVIAGAGAVGTAATDGHITVVEWCAIVATTAVALGGVYASPRNTPTPPPAE